MTSKNEVTNKAVMGKYKKHIIEDEGKKFWKFDTGKIREIPEEDVRVEIVKRAHKDL